MSKVNPEQIHYEAVQAGLKAGEAHKPVPMIVGSPSSPLGNDIDPNQPVYRVDSGVCGFGWVNIKPARGKFVSWLKKNNIGRTDSYEGGYRIPCFEFGQSLEKKERYVRAYAQVLNDHGIKAYANSRMD
jgi:hypothetical protein